MATVKEVRNTIKSHQYISDSIAYILSPENPSGNEKCFQATFLNCVNNGIASLSDQFYEIRRVFNKDYDILAHHYIQSFSPNEKITPELVHQIGAELAQKMAPGFQVIVSTHVDKDHLHNHILINSVSFETGLKWKGNGATLNAMRSESDKLCRQYGLTTIDRHSGFRGIDQATQKLAEKGESWKVKLCRVLDEAVMMCNNKNEFYAYMKRKGFEITRYTDRHITFQKIGETKKIRANTLAEQFGKNYTKERLELKMGFYRTPKPLENPPTPKPPVPFVSEFEKMERRHFEDNPPPLTPSEGKAFSQKIKKSHNPFFILLRVIHILLFRQKQRSVLDAKYERLHKKIKKQKRYKTKEPNLRTILERYDKKPAIAGNISYKDMVNSQGENLRVQLSLSAVPKLYAYPFFFSARIYREYAIVTIKKRDKELFKQILETGTEATIQKHNEYLTPRAEYQELKNRAKQLGVTVEFLIIESKQLELLHKEKDRFVSIETKDRKIRLAFLPQNKDFILHSLYPDKYKAETDNLFSVGRNSRINKLLKAEALLRSQKMKYRTLSKDQVEQLAESVGEDKFAVFSKNTDGKDQNEQYNIAFKEDDQSRIDTALRRKRRR